jgi:hypothetical protein
MRLLLALFVAAVQAAVAGSVVTSSGQVICLAFDHATIDANFTMTLYCAQADSAPVPSVLPAAPVLSAPSGLLTTRTPTYTWAASLGATSYYLLVQNTAGIAVSQWLTASDLGCDSGGTCTAKPTKALDGLTAYNWFVSAKNASGASAWSVGKTIKTP